MDDENLHINQMKKQNYPEPDVPVAEAWEGMKELLINDPGNMSSSGMEKSLFSKIFISFTEIRSKRFLRNKTSKVTAKIFIIVITLSI